ncbi:hypothetical protein GH714_000198 [Hevea brasiliensis]|uniref:Chromatin assembly factor 1 subunit A dimerization domain-containing protein n=1 Tax=Hevea brasiliensis TaxID=3981 RepID=A0A6A6KSR2_HEVBR|nr:hypothetical protein GH714_000198 [Hevea brasiliensis]
MADPSNMVVDVDAEPDANALVQPRKTLKRKRPSSTSTALAFNLTIDQKAAQIEALNKELEGLFGYYKQVVNQKVGCGFSLDSGANDGNTLNGMVGLLMEESDLPLSKLVDVIYRKLGGETEGQCECYGGGGQECGVVCRAESDTRDLKLMPKNVRGALTIRRMCRKKIQERISAVSAMISALQKLESDQTCTTDLMRASEKLGKVLQEADIRLLVDSMLQKNGAEMAGKEARREQKLLIKQLEKNKKEAEKEKKRMDLELQKEKRQTEKEQKRLQEEADKDEKRREKEESEMRRHLRKQQEEAEKEQRRREKEEAELKKRIAIQKQASIMERFIKRSKSNSPCQNDEALTKMPAPDLKSKHSEKMPGAVTVAMDHTLSSNDNLRFNDIRKLHLSSWQHLGHAIHSNRKQHWSIRQRPKTELFKELKLTATRELAHDDDSSVDKLVSRWGEQSSDDRSFVTNSESSPDCKKWTRRKQLLQFDKSYRPAFYGIWPKKSHVIGPRHPFRKDPDLDYDIDSDEEWEEEDPGESLSDCDK